MKKFYSELEDNLIMYKVKVFVILRESVLDF